MGRGRDAPGVQTAHILSDWLLEDIKPWSSVLIKPVHVWTAAWVIAILMHPLILYYFQSLHRVTMFKSLDT